MPTIEQLFVFVRVAISVAPDWQLYQRWVTYRSNAANAAKSEFVETIEQRSIEATPFLSSRVSI